MCRHFALAVALIGFVLSASIVTDAAQFATPAFQAQWEADEGRVPNFWGPLTSARDRQNEPYAQAPGGQRLVQYFDKGRMELTDPAEPAVTSGLLAAEMLTGRIQVGDTAFQSRPPPAIPIAGDPDNPGPTYATLAATFRLTAPMPRQDRATVSVFLAADGQVTTPGPHGLLPAAAATRYTYYAYDDVTQHNVPAAFDAYRQDVGLATIGLAISEPFLSVITVQGRPTAVMVQAFERRVLTYTPDHPESRQVEFGNIGQHYHRWRYSPGD